MLGEPVVVSLTDGKTRFVTKMDVTTVTTRYNPEKDARGRLIGYWETPTQNPFPRRILQFLILPVWQKLYRFHGHITRVFFA